jgi:hypothetical protein
VTRLNPLAILRPFPESLPLSPPSLTWPCLRGSLSSSLCARGPPSSAPLPSNRHGSRLRGKHCMLLYRLASGAMALDGRTAASPSREATHRGHRFRELRRSRTAAQRRS